MFTFSSSSFVLGNAAYTVKMTKIPFQHVSSQCNSKVISRPWYKWKLNPSNYETDPEKKISILLVSFLVLCLSD